MKLFLSFASLYCKGRVSLLCIWTSKQWLWSECRSSNTDWNLQLRHIWGTSRTRVKFFIPKPKTEKPKLFEKCKSCLSVFLNIYIYTHTYLQPVEGLCEKCLASQLEPSSPWWAQGWGWAAHTHNPAHTCGAACRHHQELPPCSNTLPSHCLSAITRFLT